ncbi:MAG: recombination-associated protein RdgC, partial [Polaromonas sp.]|nr:recombination-associated protein RdgC [Polaromonas sp.]
TGVLSVWIPDLLQALGGEMTGETPVPETATAPAAPRSLATA